MTAAAPTPLPGGPRRPSTVANPIDDLEVVASTPDEQVYARIRGRRELTVWLAPGYYDRATEADLTWQLSRLGRLLFASRMREYYRLRSLAFGRTVTKEPPPTSARDHAYVERREDLLATGTSPDGRIRLSATGMKEWSVQIAAGTHQALDEHAFCAAVTTAGNALIEDQFTQIARLKADVYG